MSIALSLACGGAALAQDGFYNVSYNDIGLSLTQIGGYGELVVTPNGFADMSFGSCTMNFTRDEAGGVKEAAPVVQGNSASCPDSMAFSIAPAADGLFNITFTEGGALAGQTFDLYPVLRPMQESDRITAPKGFDILGMTVGQSRSAIEAILKEKGFAPIEGYQEKQEYTDGSSRAIEVWSKGVNGPDRPEDQISLTYTTKIAGQTDEDLVEHLARKWSIPASANLSLANLQKSLAEKHGPLGKNAVGDGRHYDRSGAQVDTFQSVCDDKIALQSVRSYSSFVGEGGEFELAIACGASVELTVLEDFSAPGRASMMQIALKKGDIAYDAFWKSWSLGELKALQERYELQANMTGAAPEL